MVVGLTLIAIISYSRVYLSAHYLSDVYAGIALGLCIVALSWYFEPMVTKIFKRMPLNQRLYLAAIIGLSFTLIGTQFYSQDDNGVTLGAGLFGMLIGSILETEYVGFKINVPIHFKVYRVVLGLFMAWLAYFGLGMVLPENIATYFTVAWLGGFTVVFIAPLVFKKLKI